MIRPVYRYEANLSFSIGDDLHPTQGRTQRQAGQLSVTLAGVRSYHPLDRHSFQPHLGKVEPAYLSPVSSVRISSDAKLSAI